MKTLLCRENTTDDHAYLFTDENQKQNSSRSGQGGSNQNNGYANSSSANGIKLHRLTSGQDQSQASNLTSKNYDLHITDSLPGTEIITVDVTIEDSHFNKGQKNALQDDQGQKVDSKTEVNGHFEVKKSRSSLASLKSFQNGDNCDTKLDGVEIDDVKTDHLDVYKFHSETNGFVKTDFCRKLGQEIRNKAKTDKENEIVEDNLGYSGKTKKNKKSSVIPKPKSISIPSFREVQV